jgi:DNA excision repair protein ERCC-4
MQDTPEDMLKCMPGINEHNIHAITSNVENLYELSQLSLERMQELIGKKNGKALYDFINNDGHPIVDLSGEDS